MSHDGRLLFAPLEADRRHFRSSICEAWSSTFSPRPLEADDKALPCLIGDARVSCGGPLVSVVLEGRRRAFLSLFSDVCSYERT